MSLTLAKLNRRLPELVAAAIRAVHLLPDVRMHPASDDVALEPLEPPPPLDAPGWQPLQAGAVWGEPTEGGSVYWLAAPLRVPHEWRGQQVLLELVGPDDEQTSPEAIVTINTHLLAGLDAYHRSALLPEWAHEGQHQLLLRCSLPAPQHFGGLRLCLRDEEIFHLGQLMRTVLDAVATLAPTAPLRHTLLARLNDAYNQLDLREGWHSPAFAASAQATLHTLRHALAAGLEPGQCPAVLASGHAHLDVAWLWPIWRTRQKAVHTVATALHLMERYPDYHFSMSQPQVYAWLKHDAPDLYARLRQRAAEGRFEPVGMMWLEADCNLPSGESLVRQLLHGARFFAEEFGIINHVLWLPDTFGFSAVLPQLMRQCGISCFVTSKLSWNQSNRLPADTFRWRGIDGSEVLAHLLTTPSDDPAEQAAPVPRFTYVGKMTAQQIQGTWEYYRQGDINDELLAVYGHGDGGGGPTEEMLEAAHVLADLPGLPQVRMGRVEQFFQRLYERVWQQPHLPTWSGELYLEYHRGTYTSQARSKQANHHAEHAYREAEWLNAWAVTLGAASAQERLNHGWHLLLLNQFHDILPGTSIAQVYQDSAMQYLSAEGKADRVYSDALEHLLTLQEQAEETVFDLEEATSLYVFNSLPWQRQDALWLDMVDGRIPVGLMAAGASLLMQFVENATRELKLLVDITVPPCGYSTPGVPHVSAPVRRPPATGLLRVMNDSLENSWLRLKLDVNGEIVSLYDKEHTRELVPPGSTANQLVAYEDRPLDWEAWDIDEFYCEKPYPVQHILDWRVAEHGPIRAAIEITRQVGQSTVKQRIAMWHNRRRIDFETVVDWQERQTLLRALFPLDINTDKATCGIQFGALERPTHRNTSWEQARFEVCAHGWVDMSEDGYGVALLNTGTYGHSLQHNIIGLSLLRGTTFPDPDADQGEHHFRYSLYPHTGGWREAQVVRRAYELNTPLRVAGVTNELEKPVSFSFLSTPTEHIIIETIKVAEDGNGLIVRLYEAHNRRGPVCLVFGYAVDRAVAVDVLEREVGPVEVLGQQVMFEIRPFEIKTLRVWLSAASTA